MKSIDTEKLMVAASETYSSKLSADATGQRNRQHLKSCDMIISMSLSCVCLRKSCSGTQSFLEIFES